MARTLQHPPKRQMCDRHLKVFRERVVLNAQSDLTHTESTNLSHMEYSDFKGLQALLFLASHLFGAFGN